MFCSNCGKAVQDGTLFCPNCGAGIGFDKKGVAQAATKAAEKQYDPAYEAEKGELSGLMYNFVIGIIVLWGIAVDVVICYQFSSSVPVFNWMTVLIYFALTIAGFAIVRLSKNPVLSFVGFNILAAGMGTLLSSVVGLYEPSIVFETFMITGIVTALMILLGILWPKVFLSLGRMLGISLLGVIIVEAVMILFTGTFPGWISFVSALIFCGFIGYDWNRAQQSKHTLKNAVNHATELYVDVINLFLDILRIVGDR